MLGVEATSDAHLRPRGTVATLKPILRKRSADTSPSSQPPTKKPAKSPIQVAPKPGKKTRRPNVFYDDRGFPDQSDEFDQLLRNVDGGTVLRKRKHAAPPIDDVDPAFRDEYDETRDGPRLRKELPLTHLNTDLRQVIYDLIRKYWSVFSDKGLFVPVTVKDYECVIDTGTARPIAMKKIHYGPRETPIMRDCIAKLLKLGHIRQIHGGQWLFKALLAAKPHQEHVTDIDDFVWRFCVNYIMLNQITRVIAYPIPRCDSAVHVAFGDSKFMWLFDAPQGYHQMRVEKNSQDKLAFAGPDATKYTYQVMPFGPVNGPSTFIMFMHDMDSTWKQLASTRGIRINDDTNTNIIVDDVLSWAPALKVALAYMECQLRVCQSQNLSLSLKKTHIFPPRFEFVGIDVCQNGNRPAMSKNQLVTTWADPDIVRDIAKFVGFVQFYARFIPMFETRIERLRTIMKEEYTSDAKPHWDAQAKSEWEDMKQAVLSDPCLARYDHRKRLVLATDFSAKGFGYVALQPADDEVSLAAMTKRMAGGDFDFMSKDSKAQLRPVAFGSRRTRGNETRLHSYLGEAFCGDWAINKTRHMTFGQQFDWCTDCYAVKFILSYDGGNPAILRLQMRLMCWDMRILHRNDIWLVDADYWSRLGQDLCFDPLLRDYIQRVQAMRRDHPSPTTLPMEPENMPYYRGPRRSSPSDVAPPTAPASSTDAHAHAIVSAILVGHCGGMDHLENHPVQFGDFDRDVSLKDVRVLYNSELPLAARQLLRFDWAVYSFSNGHFISTFRTRNMPFQVVLACDPHNAGRALFREFTDCKVILDSASDMLHRIRDGGDRSKLHGYLIHSHRYLSSETTSKFWDIQASIVVQLRIIRSLSMVVAIVIPDHDNRSVGRFERRLRSDGWILSSTQLHFPDYGDSISGQCRVIIGVHSQTSTKVDPVQLRTPPQSKPAPLSKYIYAPFNKAEHAVSYAPDDEFWNKDANESDGRPLVNSEPKSAATVDRPGTRILYHLHRDDMDQSVTSGAAVLSTDSLCPPFTSAANNNLFQHYFGIEYRWREHTYVRAISPFEFVSCFQLEDDLTYKLSHPTNRFQMDAAIPARTSSSLFEHIQDRLVRIRDENCEIFEPASHAAPAATIQAFTNGAVGVRLPSKARWVRAYESDAELVRVFDLVRNPSKITNKTLSAIDHNFRGAIRRSLIVIEDDMLIYREPLHGYKSYTRLQIVPAELRNIIFVAFHTNPIGGHFNAYRTLHRIRLRYYWPSMYVYIKKMCSSCPGCALSNPVRQKSAELVYSFPMDAPMRVLHIDGFAVGKHSGFEGSEVYLIGCCGMSTFGCAEPISNANATQFASAIMKIQLRYGFSHTIVLDKDSKFFGVCREALDLLQINRHVLSGDNHNAMIVERLNRYLNKGLKIMSNERGSVRIALESILLLIYAWNSCPVPGTDISRSLLVVGREFAFPIDYSTGKHWELTSSPTSVQNYARDLATRLSACREVAELLVGEMRSWHRELVNSRRRDPRIYSPGDIVFARRAVKSDKRRGRVDKLMYPYTGPWRIKSALPGASYALEHCLHDGKTDKKHAADLSPYPAQLVPFMPVDGPDNRYGQLYKPIGKTPFAEAGIKGFEPIQPYKVKGAFASVAKPDDFHWPSLSELNAELGEFPWLNDAERDAYLASDAISTVPALYTGPPPSPPAISTPSVPSIGPMVASIINSQSKLFFIANAIGTATAREWRLVRVNFKASLATYPDCIRDGRFLVEFYALHKDDVRYNAINQRYWLQYVSVGSIDTPTIDTMLHMIRPSDTSESYAERHGLAPYRKWVNLTHHDTYIHGPFEFATVRGQKTRDRIARTDWDVLCAHGSMYQNETPKFDLPAYSVHVDRGAHVCFAGKFQL